MDYQALLTAPEDSLMRRVLARRRDPTYDDVAGLLPQVGSWDFIGTPRSRWKYLVHPDGRITIRTMLRDASGRTDCRRDVCCLFDPATQGLPYAGTIGQQQLLDGFLPVNRTTFVRADRGGAWEQTSFALTDDRGCTTVFIQAAGPGVDGGRVCFAVAEPECADPGRLAALGDSIRASRVAGVDCDAALAAVRREYDRVLAGAMQVELPDLRLANAALGGLLKGINTYVGEVPHYGATRYFCDDGRATESFPPTTISMAEACLGWGLFDRARTCLDYHLRSFVSDAGALLHRGTGASVSEHGMLLAAVACYARFTGDAETIDGWGDVLAAVCRHLLDGREAGGGLIHGCPEDDVRGWPARPWFSGNCWASRGLLDLAPVLAVSRQSGLQDLGCHLERAGRQLRRDTIAAVDQATVRTASPPFIPPWPGYAEPFVNLTDPVCFPGHASEWLFLSGYANYRFYPEMLSARILPRRHGLLIRRYRETHGGELLGLTRLRCGRAVLLDDWPLRNVLRGLLDLDQPRRFLTTLYAHLAHHQARGTFFAPESTSLERLDCIHCVPCQLTVPQALRWLLVDIDASGRALWLNRAGPVQWLEDGRQLTVTEAPTPWGRVSYRIASELHAGRIRVQVRLPDTNQPARVRVGLRCPSGWRLARAESATGAAVNGLGQGGLGLTPCGRSEVEVTVTCSRA